MTKTEKEFLDFNETLLRKLKEANEKIEKLTAEINGFKSIDKLDNLIEQQMNAKGKQKITLFI